MNDNIGISWRQVRNPGFYLLIDKVKDKMVEYICQYFYPHPSPATPPSYLPKTLPHTPHTFCLYKIKATPNIAEIHKPYFPQGMILEKGNYIA